MKIKFIEKEQRYQNEQTVYWFDTSNGVHGVVHELGVADKVIDVDGCSANLGDAKNAWMGLMIGMVTEEMIQDF